ncbi:DUF4269 domain-containing protein [Sphingomonas colocasiae]|uniref:DUF4269 domain-containing protein n=1 Tax=Sphingomonas colocasiae TaxID=1848973 RepID=A0ABS7PZW2_9SPHN|nr:DUF4269 domain-containing protein [Sphingomonas colocasiae]MBY8826170.1 DUF4269 domain-containing protein [Sphingomonas colocasiae]
MMRPDYREAIARSGVLERLSAFDPHVAGTPPLGLDLATSDIDILCHCPVPDVFAAALWQAFGDAEGFAIRQWASGARAIIADFVSHGWSFEIFGQAVPVRDQQGWRHFRVEQRLLALGGEGLRRAVLEKRRAGMKTEPAFAAVLGLPGDPYRAMLDLEMLPDAALVRHLQEAGPEAG